MEQEKKLSNVPGVKKVSYLLMLLIILTTLSANFIVAGTITEALHINTDSLQLLARNRVGRTHLDYVYSLKIHNTGSKDASHVSAQVNSSQSSAELVNNILDFADVASGETVTSQNELIVRVPRRQRVNLNALQFAVSGDFINQAPRANAGLDQTVFVGDTVQLDGSASSDTDGNQLQYHWTLISQPQTSQAILSGANVLNPHFIVDQPGTYQIQLLVNDGIEDSLPSIVTITTENAKPVANAGRDQSVFVGDTVQLDGSDSQDADSDPLTYHWSLPVRPQGSQAALNNINLIDPVFTIDLPGLYQARLQVHDDIDNSDPDSVIISTQNSRPVANAGIDQTAFVGEIIQLDAQGSSDADHDDLSYTWSLISRPDNSTASITRPLQEQTHFTASIAGIYVAQLIVHDPDSSSDPDTSRITVEVQNTNTAPIADAGTNQSVVTGQAVTLDGSASSDPEGDTISFNWTLLKPEGSHALLTNSTTDTPQFTPDITGVYTVQLIVNDGAINSRADSINIAASVNANPVINSTAITTATAGEAYYYAVNASDAEGHTLSYTLLTFPDTMQIDTLSGQLSWLPQAAGTYTVIVQVNDNHGGQTEQSYSILVSEPIEDGLPPDPATIAPELNPTEFTSLADSTAFLYSGDNPIQTGVAAGTIEAERVAIIRGEVQNNNNQPLTGVTISIKGHPEFGQTLSRADGMFDMVVNGGGLLTLNYQKAGYLPVQRKVQTPWADYSFAETIVMIPLDAQATVIDLTDNSQPFQVAQGSVQTDIDGSRQATVLFPRGMTATITLADGSTQTLSSMTFRATEYTVGENGPNRMPGPLPPSSGYTYAVELSIDEAIAAGSDSVTFNQKVPVYVDNFLNFPVGEIVPVGFYDREKAAWIPSPNGKVIKIISISNGIAQIDVTGDDIADTGTTLTDLGMTAEEQAQLAMLYTAGKSLWRVQIEHLTPWDCNWPFGPPPDAEPPINKEPKADDDEIPRNPCEESGCVIQVENQVLGEDFPITGSEFSLHYRSNRVPGRKTGTEISIPLSGHSIPASLQGIRLTINIAGRRIVENYAAQTNLTENFIWDGLDVYGRKSPQAIAVIRIEYIYQAVYYPAIQDFSASFARPGINRNVIGNERNSTISISRLWAKKLSSKEIAIPSAGFGGLTLSPHHALNHSLFLGTGGENKNDRFFFNSRAAGLNDSAPEDFSTVMGSSSFIPRAALESWINNEGAISIQPDGKIIIGNLYGDAGYLDTNGILSNSGLVDFGGNVIPKAKMGSDGSLYAILGDYDVNYHFIKNGNSYGSSTGFGEIRDFDIGKDNSLYFSYRKRIYKISPDGQQSIFAGTGERPRLHENNILALNAAIDPYDLALDTDGNVFFVDMSSHCVRKIDNAGLIHTVAGQCGTFSTRGFFGDGGLATEALLSFPRSIALDDQGNLYISDSGNARIRKVSQEGNIITLLGDGTFRFETVGHINEFSIGYPRDLELSPEGDLFFLTTFFVDAGRVNHLIKVSKDLNSNILAVSKKGTELYQFNRSGRHLDTRDTLTNELIYHFEYESNGYLSTITNIDGEITNIERLADGTPVAIIATDGERTEITLDENGYAKTLTNPAGEMHRLSYLEGGLLDIYTDPNGNIYDFDYDTKDRLINDKSPTGAGWELAITEQTQNSRTVTKTSKEGRQTTYKSETLPTKDFKRTITNPDGTATVSLEKRNGETQTLLADGTITSFTEGPDPRFGMQTPLPNKTTTSLPSGLQSTRTLTRVVTLSDPADKLSLTQQTDTFTQNGKISTSVYDAINKTLTRTSAQGRTGGTQLNDKGRPISSQVTGLNPINSEYDTRGRTKRITIGSGADLREITYSYYQAGDMQGYLQSITNALGQTASFAYDLSGRITQQTLPDSRQINFQYDANGNLIRLTPDGRPAHDFDYDGLDQPTRYLPPELIEIANPITTYQYNKDRQVTVITRPDGKTIVPVYNLITGKLERLITPQGETHYAYHATSGKLNQIVTTDNQQLDYTFDGFLPKTITWTGDINGTISQNYNNDFNLISRDINGTHSINYRYDNDQLLTQAGELILSRETQKGGLLNGTTLGLQTTTQSYTGFAELQNSTASYNGSEQISQQYSYDKLSRIKSKTETLAGESHQYEYNYDLSGRLTSVKKDTLEIESYTYDSNNNRTHKNGTIIATYDDQDRLLTYQGNSYSYTENGELKSKTNNGVATHYSYDTLDNLRQVTLPGDIIIDYLIDGQNRRIGKKVNGTLTQGFLYKDPLNPIAELNADNEIVTRFVYAEKGHVPSYLIKIDPLTHAETTYRVISDHLGSPKLIINTDDGSIAQQMDYDTWGNVIQDTNPGFQPFGFAGGIYDLHTGLVRFGVRDYDAEAGRWTAKDPIRFAGGDTNLYGYVVGDPVNFVDPLGLTQEDINNMAEYVQRTQPDLNVDLDIGTLPMVENGEGITDPFTGNIWINEKYLNEKLSPSELYYLERLIIHESIHRTRPWWDSFFRPLSHDDIYDEAKYRHKYRDLECP